MLQNGWHSEIKLLASASAVLRGAANDNASEDLGGIHTASTNRCDSFGTSRSTVAGRLLTKSAVLSTSVDNFVDRSDFVLLFVVRLSPTESEAGGFVVER